MRSQLLRIQQRQTFRHLSTRRSDRSTAALPFQACAAAATERSIAPAIATRRHALGRPTGLVASASGVRLKSSINVASVTTPNVRLSERGAQTPNDSLRCLRECRQQRCPGCAGTVLHGICVGSHGAKLNRSNQMALLERRSTGDFNRQHNGQPGSCCMVLDSALPT